jgi:hypothetical protein
MPEATFAAPAVKLIIAGILPERVRARKVTNAPIELGSIRPTWVCLPSSTSSLRASTDEASRSLPYDMRPAFGSSAQLVDMPNFLAASTTAFATVRSVFEDCSTIPAMTS